MTMSADDTRHDSPDASVSVTPATEVQPDLDRITTQKRKASPTSPDGPDEVSPKRARVQDDAEIGEGSASEDGVVDNTTTHLSKGLDGSDSPRQRRDSHTRTERGYVDENVLERRELSKSQQPPSMGPQGRRNVSHEEKKRGQRLFGGLLSTLSQTTANPQQKKRLEIERRQQERAAQQRAEDEKHRAEKQAKVLQARKIEQVKFDEQVMQTSHSNMLAMAHSLRTRSKPHIYYRPWELTKAQETTIKEQISEAEQAIERETQAFKLRKEQRLRDLGATVGEPAPRLDTNTDPAPTHVTKPSHDRDHDDAGDVMVEAEEDTVIY